LNSPQEIGQASNLAEGYLSREYLQPEEVAAAGTNNERLKERADN
jgi:hypothetical protein